MKAIIVEDEPIAARRLKRLIAELPHHNIIITHTYDNIADTAAHLLANPHPDLLFLDIHVADGNSFELLNVVFPIKSDIIFTTAYNEYGPLAFRKNALDYLLKPIKIEELDDAINKKERLTRSELETLNEEFHEYKNRFLIRFGSKIHVVKTDEIAYIYSENKISYFVLHSGKKIPSDYSLQELERMLNPKYFFRVNRQLIVFIDAIHEILTYSKSRVKLKLLPNYEGNIVVSTETTPKFKFWLDR